MPERQGLSDPGASRCVNASNGSFHYNRSRAIIDPDQLLSGPDFRIEKFLLPRISPNQEVDNAKRELRVAAESGETVIFFESPYRLSKTLAACIDVMPERQLCVARELTKKFEEFRIGTAGDSLRITRPTRRKARSCSSFPDHSDPAAEKCGDKSRHPRQEVDRQAARLANKRRASAVKLRSHVSVHVLETMRPEISSTENSARSCGLCAIPVSLALAVDGDSTCSRTLSLNKAAARGDYDVMTRSLWLLSPLLAGLVIDPAATCDGDGPACAGRLVFGALRHAGPARQLLVYEHRGSRIPDHCPAHRSQGDGSIKRRFFPAYPAIAAAFRYGLNISTGTALLITAQLAAWGFWSYFFLLQALEHFARTANLRRVINRRPSCSILSDCRLLRIVVFDGAAWLHLLEYCGGAIREILGGCTRHCHVWQRGLSGLYAQHFRWCARFFKLDGAAYLSRSRGFARRSRRSL